MAAMNIHGPISGAGTSAKAYVILMIVLNVTVMPMMDRMTMIERQEKLEDYFIYSLVFCREQAWLASSGASSYLTDD